MSLSISNLGCLATIAKDKRQQSRRRGWDGWMERSDAVGNHDQALQATTPVQVRKGPTSIRSNMYPAILFAGSMRPVVIVLIYFISLHVCRKFNIWIVDTNVEVTKFRCALFEIVGDNDMAVKSIGQWFANCDKRMI